MPTLLDNTSERVIEEHYVRSRGSYLIYLMHIATYRFAALELKGKRVLDLGCGTGYGTALLADTCETVCGVDISDEAIGYAHGRYVAPNLSYEIIEKIENGRRMRFENASFDAVISFQVIEHVQDIAAYLSEVKRVLKPGGLFVVATPDRATRLLPGQRPWNQFHLTEYSSSQFVELLSRQFCGIRLMHMSGTASVIGMELARTRRLKWLTLPFTFPFAPEWWRRAGLAWLKRIERSKSKPDNAAATAPFDFDERDIQIGRGLAPSLNLIAIMSA
jgi:SAM-dependent methyltransferase